MDAAYRRVYLSILAVLRSGGVVSDDERLLFFVILTHEKTNMLGVFRLPVDYLKADLGWTIERTQEAFQKLLEKEIILYDPYEQLLMVHPRLNHVPISDYTSPLQFKRALHIVAGLPRSEIYIELIAYLEKLKNRSGFRPIVDGLKRVLIRREFQGHR